MIVHTDFHYGSSKRRLASQTAFFRTNNRLYISSKNVCIQIENVYVHLKSVYEIVHVIVYEFDMKLYIKIRKLYV